MAWFRKLSGPRSQPRFPDLDYFRFARHPLPIDGSCDWSLQPQQKGQVGVEFTAFSSSNRKFRMGTIKGKGRITRRTNSAATAVVSSSRSPVDHRSTDTEQLLDCPRTKWTA